MAMTKKRVVFVHNQYNSPLGLYSAEEVANTLSRHTKVLENGAVGIDFALLSAPNLAQSAVYKMLTEEQSQIRRPWTQQNNMTSSSEVKRVAWPPTAAAAATADSHENNNSDYDTTTRTEKQAPPVPPKPNRNSHQVDSSEEDMSIVPEAFASNELVGQRELIAKPAPPPGLILCGRPLKKQAPISQEPNAVFDSQPVFKRAAPVRMLGDMVWPPKPVGEGGSQGSREADGPSRRQAKDYRGFFSQHQLPPNFPTYRAPPGTQHFGLEEGENQTPM